MYVCMYVDRFSWGRSPTDPNSGLRIASGARTAVDCRSGNTASGGEAVGAPGFVVPRLCLCFYHIPRQPNIFPSERA